MCVLMCCCACRDVAVSPAWQRSGLGRAMIERLTNQLVQDGISTITLYAEPQVGVTAMASCHLTASHKQLQWHPVELHSCFCITPSLELGGQGAPCLAVNTPWLLRFRLVVNAWRPVTVCFVWRRLLVCTRSWALWMTPRALGAWPSSANARRRRDSSEGRQSHIAYCSRALAV